MNAREGQSTRRTKRENRKTKMESSVSREVQKQGRCKSCCYKYNAPATPTAGPNTVVGTSTLAIAPIGPPRIGIFLMAPFVMWTAKMPPIMNRPRRLPLSRATRFSTSLAILSKYWYVISESSEREGLHSTAPRMSSWVMGRNTSFTAFVSKLSEILCKENETH